jgi:hypothetical protein
MRPILSLAAKSSDFEKLHVIETSSGASASAARPAPGTETIGPSEIVLAKYPHRASGCYNRIPNLPFRCYKSMIRRGNGPHGTAATTMSFPSEGGPHGFWPQTTSEGGLVPWDGTGKNEIGLAFGIIQQIAAMLSVRQQKACPVKAGN